MCGTKPISAGGRTRLLVIFTGTYFIAALAVLSFAPLLPFIQEDLLLDKTHLGFFISAAYLGAMLAGFPCGWMADRCGVILTISVGLVLQGVFLAITAAISSFFWMIFAVFIAGAGFGAVNPATSKGIINWFPAEFRSTAMAVKQMGFTAGTMGSAAILPAFAISIGWRSAVFLVAVFVFLCGIVTYFIYPSEIRNNDGPQKHHPSNARLLPMQTEAQAIWKHNQILFWSTICIFYAIVQTSGTTYLAVYMVDHFQYSKVMAGLFLSITQGGGVLGRIVWGRISDIYFADNRDTELILLGFIAAAASIALGALPGGANSVLVGFIAVVFGFTAIGYSALYLTLIGELAGQENAGRAIGASITIAYTGVVLGPVLFGLGVDNIGFQNAWIGIGLMLILVLLATIHINNKFFKKDRSEI